MDPEDAYDVLDLKALRCFWATAKQGSLTRAGIDLGISEAAVSQRLKALETRLGTKLYETRGGRFRLTSAGQRAADLAMTLFDWLDEFRDAVAGEAAAETVTLSAHEPVLRYLLPDVVHRFTRESPRARLRVLSRTPRETVELVRRNEVDVGIIPDRPLPDALHFQPWRTYEAYLLVPRGHPLVRRGVPAIRDVLTAATVTQYPLIVPEIEDPEHQRVARALRRLGLPFNLGLEVGTIETVKHYVSRGLGIAVVSGLCLRDGDEHAFHAIQIPSEFEGATTYGVLTRRDKHLTALLTGLLACLGRESPTRIEQSARPTKPIRSRDR